MKYTIATANLLSRQSLTVDESGVLFAGASFGSSQRFGFDSIVCVLMAPNCMLSFQVGEKVFSIQTQPDNQQHQEAIAALLAGVSATDPGAVAGQSPPPFSSTG